MTRLAPDIAARTTGASPRGQIVFATVGAFAVTYVAKMRRFRKREFQEAAYLTGRGLVGWGVLLIALSAMSDFETTQQLGIAFAWLILITAVLVSGPEALAVLQAELNKKGAT